MLFPSRFSRPLSLNPHPRPASFLDPAMAGPLLDLHAALDLDSLGSSLVHLIDTALPVNDLIAALP